MSDPHQTARALKVMNDLMEDKPANVAGAGLSQVDDEWHVVIYLKSGDETALDQFPEEVDGVRIDVVASGEFELDVE